VLAAMIGPDAGDMPVLGNILSMRIVPKADG